MKHLSIMLILLLTLLLACKEEYKTEGYFVDDNYYEVIAYGKAPSKVENKVKSRNMAKEAALIYAQKYIQDKFKNSSEIIGNGIIVETSFYNDKFCKIIYRVKVKR